MGRHGWRRTRARRRRGPLGGEGPWVTRALGRRGPLGGEGLRLEGSVAKPLVHLVVIDHAGLLEDWLPLGQDDEVRDSLDAVAGGECGVGLCIDLEDEGVAGHIGGGAGDLGGGGSARTAPGGPKVDEDGYFCVGDDVVEEGGVGGDGFGLGRNGGFAGATSPDVGEVGCGDAIFLLTVSASTDEGHGRAFPGIWMQNVNRRSKADRFGVINKRARLLGCELGWGS
jgi:hypothetical protein